MKKKLVATLLAATTIIGCLTGCSVSAGTEIGNIDVLEKFDESGIINAEVVIEDMDVESEATKYSHSLDNGSGEYVFTIDSETYTFEISDNEITKVINDDDEVVWTPEMFNEEDANNTAADDSMESLTEGVSNIVDERDHPKDNSESKNYDKKKDGSEMKDVYDKHKEGDDKNSFDEISNYGANAVNNMKYDMNPGAKNVREIGVKVKGE